MSDSRSGVVIVTGGGSGIGAATASRVAAGGAAVAVFDVDLDAAQRTVAGIGDAGGRAAAWRVDVSARDQWQTAVDDVVATWGPLTGLVNNAGVTRDRSLLKLTDEDWQTVIDINLRGVFLGCQIAVPKMAAGGSIVNLSSEARWGGFGQANYSAAKAGVVGLTRTVAIEIARKQLRCNAIAPGTIDTPMVAAVAEDIRATWVDAIPLRRFGEPEDVAAAAAFLLGPDSKYITGQVLCVDGGSSH